MATYTENTIYLGGKTDEYTVTVSHPMQVKPLVHPPEGRYMGKEEALRKIETIDAGFVSFGWGSGTYELTVYKYQNDPSTPPPVEQPAPEPSPIIDLNAQPEEEEIDPIPEEPAPTEEPK